MLLDDNQITSLSPFYENSKNKVTQDLCLAVQSILSTPQVTSLSPFTRVWWLRVTLQDSEKGAVISASQPGPARLCCMAMDWIVISVSSGDDDLSGTSDVCFSLDLERDVQIHIAWTGLAFQAVWVTAIILTTSCLTPHSSPCPERCFECHRSDGVRHRGYGFKDTSRRYSHAIHLSPLSPFASAIHQLPQPLRSFLTEK